MEINIIPVENYSFYYINVIYVTGMITSIHLYLLSIDNINNHLFLKVISPLTLLFVVFYLGMRPIDDVFGDMTTYNRHFERYAEGSPILTTKDVFFHIFLKLCSQIMSANSFFLLCSALYVVPLYFVCKKWFEKYWFYAFLLCVGAFSFWGYGANGIRNGIATSFFLLAISQNRFSFKIFFFLISVGFHKSMLLPLGGYFITYFYNNSKPFFLFWLFSIPLSLALPGFWENLFSKFIEDDRVSYLNNLSSSSEKGGFRWDFILYSASGVAVGWYFIFKKKYKDLFYIRIFNIFLFANAFWILVIRANFSNRFAYLSWFLLSILIVYPFLKNNFSQKKGNGISWILFLYLSFTYIMALPK